MSKPAKTVTAQRLGHQQDDINKIVTSTIAKTKATKPSERREEILTNLKESVAKIVANSHDGDLNESSIIAAVTSASTLAMVEEIVDDYFEESVNQVMEGAMTEYKKKRTKAIKDLSPAEVLTIAANVKAAIAHEIPWNHYSSLTEASTFSVSQFPWEAEETIDKLLETHFDDRFFSGIDQLVEDALPGYRELQTVMSKYGMVKQKNKGLAHKVQYDLLPPEVHERAAEAAFNIVITAKQSYNYYQHFIDDGSSTPEAEINRLMLTIQALVSACLVARHATTTKMQNAIAAIHSMIVRKRIPVNLFDAIDTVMTESANDAKRNHGLRLVNSALLTIANRPKEETKHDTKLTVFNGGYTGKRSSN